MQRIPSLDGLRAVAITMVVLCHAGELRDSPLHHLKNLGTLGVRVFFVISGMLITRLLVQEWQQNGKISLKQFYIRRTLRIFPAMWFYVAVMAALSMFGIISLQRYDILCALTYTMNYATNRAWYLGHIWSLSVEEQFYLLWPVAVCLYKPRLAAKIALLALVLAPLCRLAMILWLPTVSSHEWFPTACDSLATGCCLTLLAPKLRQRWIAPCIASRWFFAVPLFVLLANALKFHVEGRSLTNENARILFLLLDTVGVTLMNFGIALTIERVVEYPNDMWGRLLNWKPVVWLGTISYSLYLWQMPFFDHDHPTWVDRLPLNIVFALAAACISYYCVEKPILQLRNRIAKRNQQRVLSTAP
jgi:peptidoglycan/LPS O-acetylase OafA/YrhL